MSTNNFVPTVWSARMLRNFRRKFVYRGLCNMDYEGEISGAGDTVKINTPGAITVGDYSGSVSYEELPSTQQALLIDQQKYWAFKVPNVDEAQSNVRLVDTYSEEAAIAMGNSVDANIAGLYTQAGETVALDVSSNSDGVWIALNSCNQALDENDVPDEGRYVILSPLVWAKFKNNSNFIHASDMGDALLRSGQLGELDGFAIFKSNNVQIATQHKCIFGHRSAVSFAGQFVQAQAGQMEDEFSDYMRGLFVFGRKVTRPNAYGVLNTTVA